MPILANYVSWIPLSLSPISRDLRVFGFKIGVFRLKLGQEDMKPAFTEGKRRQQT